MDEREIFADFLVGTPIEGDAGELNRLMRVDGTLARMHRSCPSFAPGRPIVWPGRWRLCAGGETSTGMCAARTPAREFVLR